MRVLDRVLVVSPASLCSLSISLLLKEQVIGWKVEGSEWRRNGSWLLNSTVLTSDQLHGRNKYENLERESFECVCCLAFVEQGAPVNKTVSYQRWEASEGSCPCCL